MTIFHRVNIAVVVAGAGWCGVVMTLSPAAAAVPFSTGGTCIEMSSGGGGWLQSG